MFTERPIKGLIKEACQEWCNVSLIELPEAHFNLRVMSEWLFAAFRVSIFNLSLYLLNCTDGMLLEKYKYAQYCPTSVRWSNGKNWRIIANQLSVGLFS